MAGVAVERIGGKRMRGGIDSGGVAPGTLRRKDIGLPGLAVISQDGKLPVTNELQRAVVQRAADDVCGVFRELWNTGFYTHLADGPGMRFALPSRSHHVAMAK